MRRRSRLLRVAKWCGLGTSLAIGVIILLSQFWIVSWGRQPGWGWFLNRGLLGWTRAAASVGSNWPDRGWHAARTRWRWQRPAGTIVGGREPIRWSYPKRYVQPGRISILIPLWLPLVIIALPTARVWWTDYRRPKPGHCKCGYDLTGNVSGVCPECGQETKS